eukprot:CAMPEP_0169091502 /NCGR_PEP_ID=MMETSP1015-20121227/16396_1 /TAXON_ID=342587 /ORGANISM="Karlodinium micrum, Strain CCMP2283" /LENGTH=605 /DNA_ID=CAMNT_0009151997 /DNA_START=42 /DNA_END=1860 /DNA_ORIENTATION=-
MARMFLLFIFLIHFQSFAFRVHRAKRKRQTANRLTSDSGTHEANTSMQQRADVEAVLAHQSEAANISSYWHEAGHTFSVKNHQEFIGKCFTDIFPTRGQRFQTMLQKIGELLEKSLPKGGGAMLDIAELRAADGQELLKILLMNGVAWPDCPLKGDIGFGGSCVKGAPLHDGFYEMAIQALHGEAGKMMWSSTTGIEAPNGLEFIFHTMSSIRLAIQHHHASPWLPIHKNYLDKQQHHLAIHTNGNYAARSYSKHWSGLAKVIISTDYGLSKKISRPRDLGKIFHIVQDSFSESHALRKMKCRGRVKQLQDIPIKKVLSMDDVRWLRPPLKFLPGGSNMSATHVDADEFKGPFHRAECRDRAMDSTVMLLEIMLPFLLGWGPRHNPIEFPLDRIRDFLCQHVFAFEDDDRGAGGTIPELSLNKEFAQSLRELGMKLDEDDWYAERPLNSRAKREVTEHFLYSLADIDSWRAQGDTFLDQHIPYWYPHDNCPAEWNYMPWEISPAGDVPRCANRDLCVEAPPVCYDLFALPRIDPAGRPAKEVEQEIMDNINGFLEKMIIRGSIAQNGPPEAFAASVASKASKVLSGLKRAAQLYVESDPMFAARA